MGDSQIDGLKKELGVIFDRLTRIETKLSERCEARSGILEHLERRVRQLEYDKYKVIGAAVGLSAAANFLLKGLGVE